MENLSSLSTKTHTSPEALGASGPSNFHDHLSASGPASSLPGRCRAPWLATIRHCACLLLLVGLAALLIPSAAAQGTPDSCTSSQEADTRLRNGNTSNEGRVEICLNDPNDSPDAGYVWATVCDDYWTTSDAHVVCRQLGYVRGVSGMRKLLGSHFGAGRGPILLDDLICNGDESSLLDCEVANGSTARDVIGVHNCSRGETVGVRCTNSSGDATLESLSLTASGNPIPINPSFESIREGYQASVNHGVTSALLSATPTDEDARIEFLDSADMSLGTGASVTLSNLPVGQYMVKIKVTSNDGLAEITYSLTITRAALPNRPATGQPSISGTFQVGQPLTASPGSIADADGLTNAVYRYQWIRVDSSNNETDIPNATGSTYVLTSTDEDNRIKVRASFEDDLGNPEARTSSATSLVQAAPKPSLSVANLTVSEDAGNARFTVTMSETFNQTVSVGWAASTESGDTATADSDYAASSGTVTITSGNTRATFDVPIAQDSDVESSETFTVTLSNATPGGDVVIGTGTATGTITDDDAPPANNPATGMPEISGTAQVEQTLTASPGTIADADGLTNATYRYQWRRVSSSNSVSDIANATGTTYEVTTADVGSKIRVKASFDDDLGNPGTRTSFSTDTVQAAPTTPSLSVADVTVSEDAGNARFTVTMSETFNQTVSVGWAASTESGDTATADSDYAASSGTVTITSGNTRATFDVPIAQDSDVESSETFTVTLSNATPGGDVVIGTGTATGTITDDDAPPANNPATGMPEISGTAQVEQTLTASPGTITDADGLTNATYRYQWRRVSSSNSVSDIANATGTTYEVTTADVGSKIRVKASFDDDLGNPGTRTSFSTDTVQAAPTTPSLSVADVTVSEDAGNARFTVTMSETFNQTVSVGWAASTESGDTATADSDYAASSGTVTITSGNTRATFDVPIAQDSDVESSETFTVTLSNATPGGDVVIGTDTATGTITDDDAPPANNPATGMPEISGTAQVEQTLTASPGTIADADGLTNATYRYQWRRVSSSNSVSDIANATGTTYEVTTADVGSKIRVKASFDDDLGNPGTRTSFSTDTVQAAPTTPSLSVADVTVSEDAGNARFTVTMSETFNQTVSVGWAASTESGDTATADSDYAASSGTVTITSGNTRATFDVPIAQDSDVESSETFTVTLSNATPGGDVVIGTDTATGTITDDDAPPANNPATGMPEISGTAQVEQTLTASPGTIADADGLTNATYRYQWRRVSSSNSVSDIANATGTTYEVTTADVGSKIRVKASFDDDLGNPGTRTSFSTDTVQAAPTTPSLSVADVTVSEDAGNARFTVTMSETFNQTVSVGWAASTESGDTATADSDYAASSGTVTITSGNTRATFDVPIAQDSDVESSETFTVTLSNATPGGDVVIGTGTATGTITDDDAPPANNPATGMPEISGTAQVEQTLTASPGTIADADGLTNATYRYQWRRVSSSNSVSDIANATGTTYVVTTADVGSKIRVKASFDDDLGNPGTRTSFSTDTVQAAPTTPSLSVADVTVSEDAGNARFTVTMSETFNQTVSVGWAASTESGDTATADSDYAASSGTVTITSGNTRATFDVPIAQDSDVESSETFTVTLSNATPGGDVVIGTDTATGTITDDDDNAPPPIEEMPEVTLVLLPISIMENGGVSQVSAIADKAYSEPYTVIVSTEASVSAVGAGYVQSGTTLNFAPGATRSTGSVLISAQDNQEDEPDKIVMVSGSLSLAGAEDPEVAVLIIIDDDEAAPPPVDETPTVTLALTPSSVSENGGVSTVTATVSPASSQPFTLSVSAAAVSPATAGDFTLSGTTLSFAADATSSAGVVTITAVDNQVDAPDKTVIVKGTALLGSVQSPSDATLTITDDDEPIPPTVTLVLTPTSITEKGGVSRITATASPAWSEPFTVTVSADAASPTVAGDFILSGTTLRFAADATQSTGVVIITAVDNQVDATNKKVTVAGTVSLSEADDPTDATLTITDDENTPVVTLVLTPSLIVENGGVSTVTATASPASAQPFTVTISASEVSPAIAGDFTLSGTTLNFAAGATQSTGEVTITAIDNQVDARDKRVTVAGAVTLADADDPADATLTIADNEQPPVVTLVLTPGSIMENGGVSRVTATASPASSEAFTVTVSAAAVSPAVAGDFTLSGTRLNFAAGATSSTGSVTINAVDNNVDAPNKSVNVSGSVSLADADDPTDTTLTITDDDAPPRLTLVLTPGSISENGGVSTITATASTASAKAFNVTISAQAVSPAVAGDFTLSGTRLNFAAGATSSTGSVTITAVDNNEDTPNKSVTLSGSASLAEAQGPANLALTITDDDEPPPPPDLNVADARGSELDGQLVFEVTLSKRTEEAVTVNFATADGTALAGADYVSKTGTLTIEAGGVRGLIEVEILADLLNEDDENLTLHLSNVSGAVLADDDATGWISGKEDLATSQWLARFGRTSADHLLDAVEDQLWTGDRENSQVTLAGWNLTGTGGGLFDSFQGAPSMTPGAPGFGSGYGLGWNGAPGNPFLTGAGFGGRSDLHALRMAGRELLSGTAVRLSAGGNDARNLSLWARGAYSRFDGSDNELLGMSGEVITAAAGVDYAGERSLIGVALSHSWAEGTFGRDGNNTGSVTSQLTGLYPYMKYRVANRLWVWGIAGYGYGLMISGPDSSPHREEADLITRLGAVGARGELISGAGGFSLAVKADVLTVRTESDEAAGLLATEGDARRLRVGLEGSHQAALKGDSSLRSHFGLALRQDNGDADKGFGVEVSGGLDWEGLTPGLSVNLGARGLIAHGADEFEEWGLSGGVRYDPTPSSHEGLRLGLTQSLGAPIHGRLGNMLWNQTPTPHLAALDTGQQLNAELAYGLETPVGLGIPWARAGLSGDSGGFRLGYSLITRYGVPSVELGDSMVGRDFRLAWELNVRCSARVRFEFMHGAGNPGVKSDTGLALSFRSLLRQPGISRCQAPAPTRLSVSPQP